MVYSILLGMVSTTRRSFELFALVSSLEKHPHLGYIALSITSRRSTPPIPWLCSWIETGVGAWIELFYSVSYTIFLKFIEAAWKLVTCHVHYFVIFPSNKLNVTIGLKPHSRSSTSCTYPNFITIFYWLAITEIKYEI